MTLTEIRIQEAAAKNKELLRILAETDHAVPDLTQQQRFIADLDAQLSQSNARIQALDRRRVKELKDHEKYRDSVMRRFAYKATGKKEKFESKAQKEETEYFEVLQEEHREKQLNQNLTVQLEEANAARKELEQQAALHGEMQRELDNLYNAIFSGPTPEFPDEDAQEKRTNAALQAYQDCRNRAESEAHAARLLGSGKQQMLQAMAAMRDALKYSTRDMWGGGTFTDMMERNALHQADVSVLEARMLVTQAQRMSSAVGNLPAVTINQGHLMRDVFFDNIWTDMAFHEEIQKSAGQVEEAARVMDQMAWSASNRASGLEAELRIKEKTLADARVALQKAREQAFEKVLEK